MVPLAPMAEVSPKARIQRVYTESDSWFPAAWAPPGLHHQSALRFFSRVPGARWVCAAYRSTADPQNAL